MQCYNYSEATPDIGEFVPSHGASVLNHDVATGVIQQRGLEVKGVHQ